MTAGTDLLGPLDAVPAPPRAPALPGWLIEQTAPGEHPFDALTRAWLLGFASVHTRGDYGRDVARYRAFLAPHDPLRADRAHVDAFARSLDVAGYAPRTQRRALSAVSSLYAYAIERGAYTGDNPARYVRRPPPPTTRGRHLTQTQAQTLLATVDATGHEQRLRDRLILRLFLVCALRVSEVCRLDVGDADLATGMLRVRGKGGEHVDVPIPAQVESALRDYLPHRSPPPIPASAAAEAAAALEHAHPGGRGSLREPLFYLGEPHWRGTKPSRGVRITPDAITSRLRILAAEAGLPPALAAALTPHDLRHTALTALSGIAPFAVVVDLARHKRSDTTLLYIHPDPASHGSHRLADHLEPPGGTDGPGPHA